MIVVKGSAKPPLEKNVVGKGGVRVLKGSARPLLQRRRVNLFWEGRVEAGDGAHFSLRFQIRFALFPPQRRQLSQLSLTSELT